MQLQRPRYLFLVPLDTPLLDIEELLCGTVVLDSVPQMAAVSVLRGELFLISADELEVIERLSGDSWSSVESLGRASPADLNLFRELGSKGLILTDIDEEPFIELRRRNELLRSSGWDAYAALYHFMTRWSQMDLRTMAWPVGQPQHVDDARGSVDRFIELFGKPPRHFHSVQNPVCSVRLPLVAPEDGIYDLLTRRKTTRAFDPSVPMALEDLATILFYVFGCHGLCRVTDDFVGLKRTSPSGGGLHPIEAYPLIVNVTGLRSGIYHYDVEHHALALLEELTPEDAIETATAFAAGQAYFGMANALFMLTARFYRNFWKYRRNGKTYSVLLMDAAHLSQTLYLICTQLGLGAFITTAINAIDIEERLGLDGFAEGTLAMLGCGIPAQTGEGLEPSYVSYVPS
jgi:putative peptide maturation dehydrogenase